ncbi:complement C1r subcomponent-like protein [Centroberyx gerrardi]
MRKSDEARRLETGAGVRLAGGTAGTQRDGLLCVFPWLVSPSALSGMVQSPRFPQPYLAEQLEMWDLSVPEGYQLQLTFTLLHIRPSKNCGQDSLTVVYEQRVLGKFCGDATYNNVCHPGNTPILSPGNKLRLVFQLGEIRPDELQQFKGFSALYRAIGKTVKVDEIKLAWPGQSVILPCTTPEGPLPESTEGEGITVAVFHPIHGTFYPESPLKGRVTFSSSPVFPTNPSIQIKGVKKTDEGKYTCQYAYFPVTKGTTPHKDYLKSWTIERVWFLSSIPLDSEQLVYFPFPIEDQQQCRKSIDRYTDRDVEADAGRFIVNMFCAGWSDGKADACGGESGVPYVLKDGDGNFVAAGIYSWIHGRCDTDDKPKYGVYTQVSRYLDWIKKTMREN